MAQFYSTGPALFYVGVEPDSTDITVREPRFFGTSEGPPFIDEVPGFAPVQNDLHGGMLPQDHAFQSRIVQISTVINRMNINLWYAMCRRSQVAGDAYGSHDLTDVGSFQVDERYAFPLWVVFPASGAPTNPGAGGTPKVSMTALVGGYRFWAAILRGPNRRQVGSQQKKLHVQWYCHSVLTGLASPEGNELDWTVNATSKWRLFDENLASVPAIN